MDKRIVVLAFLSATFAGCAVTDPNRYKDTPTAQLCLAYMTMPSINVYQGARAAELARRGEDCSRYGDVAAARQRADGQLQNLTNSLKRPPQRPVDAPQTQTYIINGKMVTCTTTGTVTNCF